MFPLRAAEAAACCSGLNCVAGSAGSPALMRSAPLGGDDRGGGAPPTAQCEDAEKAESRAAASLAGAADTEAGRPVIERQSAIAGAGCRARRDHRGPGRGSRPRSPRRSSLTSAATPPALWRPSART